MDEAAWIQAGATIVLVVITAWYAKTTHDLLRQQREFRRRDRSEAAAYAVLGALREPAFLPSAPVEMNHATVHVLRHTLIAEIPLLDDTELRRRLATCERAAFEVTSGDVSPTLGRVPGSTDLWGYEPIVVDEPKRLFAELVAACRGSVEAYLAESTVPSWPDSLPTATDARAWIAKARGPMEPPDDSDEPVD